MNILSLPIDMGATQIDSRYRLVIAAAQRARQLIEGNHPHVESRYQKETSRALEEILSGQADILFGPEARRAIIEERRRRDSARSRARSSSWSESSDEARR